jgi:hypothetical protein
MAVGSISSIAINALAGYDAHRVEFLGSSLTNEG